MSFMQPPVQQPPQVTQSITIFPNPTAGEFGLVGATAKGSSTDAGASLGPISTADADQPHIRFDTSIGGGIYEIQLPGGEWDELIPYGQGTGPNVATDSTGDVQLVLSGSRDNGYKYSEVASYIATGPQQFGAIAFGTLTAAGGVPVTGSATYSGTVMGSSDVIASDAFDGLNRATVSGSVSLDFDFAAGTLGGAMTRSTMLRARRFRSARSISRTPSSELGAPLIRGSSTPRPPVTTSFSASSRVRTPKRRSEHGRCHSSSIAETRQSLPIT